MTDVDPLAALSRRFGSTFADPELLTRALTHPSYANEHPPAGDNEALALVGDAALGLVVAEHLVRVGPDAPVGTLTQERARLVSGENLARWARDLGLGDWLRLGRGLERDGGRDLESVLATALEAVLGVLYLEDGLAAVRRVVAGLALW
jgi:ribonuclease III